MRESIIAPGVLFDGNNLVENNQIIPIGTESQVRIIEKLLEARGDTVSYKDLYRYAWEFKEGLDFEEGLASKKGDTTPDFKKSIHDLYTKFPKGVKKYVKNVSNKGYRLLIQETFKLNPQYTAEKKNAEEVFSLCPNNIRQSKVLAEMQKRAFMRQPYVFSIIGQPGMGKTELAKAFAAECCLSQDTPYRLRYENVIMTTYRKDGLSSTVRNLPVEGNCDEKDLDQRILDSLRGLKKTLLVIDNVDIGSTDEDWEKTFERLKGTGCHILLTSRSDLPDMLKIPGLTIPQIETDQLVKLFCEISGEEPDEEQTEKLKALIETHLQNNVYLVTLAAGLMEFVTVDTLITAFEATGAMRNLHAVTYDNQNGRKQNLDTLTGHYARLFKMCDMTSSEKKLMMNLALLPVEGMNIEEFYQYAFAEQEKTQAYKDCRFLREKYWVVQRKRDISLHPMVREVILAEMEACYNDEIRMYMQNLADSMNHTHFSVHLHHKLQYALEAYAVIRCREIISFEAAQLVAQIASVYDTLTDKKNAYEYGMKAVEFLDTLDRTRLSDEDLFRLAQAYNVTGYSVLRGKHEGLSLRNYSPKRIATARKALAESEKILKNLQSTALSQEKIALLLSKVSGNTAACFHEEGNYSKSRDLHEEALKYRLEINCASGGKYLDMVASAYKNIATEYFYLSRIENRKRNLEISYENHCEAVRLYDKLRDEYSLEWCIAANRMIGTGLHMLETGLFSDKTVLAGYLEMMMSAFSYLTSIDPVKDELRNSLGNIVRIFDLQEDGEAVKTAAAKVLQLSEFISEEDRKDFQQLLNSIQRAV